MEGNSSPLTAPVTGSHSQDSAAVHRLLSSSRSASSSTSRPLLLLPPSPSPTFCARELRHSRPRGELTGLLARNVSITGSNWSPLPTTNLQSERSREPISGAQSIPARGERSDSTLSSIYPFSDRFATIRRGDFIIDSSGPPRPSPRRGHRRRSTHVTPADLDSFRREVLGIETPPSIVPEEENPSRQNQNPSSDPQFEQLNTAFASATMSLNSGSGMSSNNSGSSVFSGYVDNSSVPRPPMSPALSHTSSQVNGGSMPGMNGNVPMNAGHQMDLQHLYDMVLELSDVLKNNREMTKNIVTSAEDLMVCVTFIFLICEFWTNRCHRTVLLLTARPLMPSKLALKLTVSSMAPNFISHFFAIP